MSNNCDDSFKQIQELQEQNRQLQEQLEQAERLRKAAGVYTRTDVGETFILPGRNGVPRELGQAEIQRGYQQLAGQMNSKEVDDIVSRGLDERARPMGADGRFTNYDTLLREIDIKDVEDYAKLSEALGLTLQRQAPDDFAFVTESYGKDRILDIAAGAYADLGIPGDVLRARMATNAARFGGIVESKVWLRFWADRSKKGMLDALEKMSEYMRDLPGSPVPDNLKAEAFSQYRVALVFERHNAYAKRRVAQALRSEQDEISGLDLRLDLNDDQEGMAEAIGMTAREAEKAEDSDFVEYLFTATTHDYLMFFTTMGRCYVERVFEIPEGSRASKGRSIANPLELKQDEKIASTIRVQGQKTPEETWNENLHILFATKTGVIKKSNLSSYRNIRKGGIIAINVEEGDELIAALMTDGHNEIVLITKDGMSIRFSEEDIRDMGRTATGVWGIRPDKKDFVIGAALVQADATLLVAGAKGVGKRTEFDEYRLQKRGGKGIITMKVTDKTGEVVSALSVRENDEIMLITSGGQSVRTRVSEIRMTGRNAQGVRLIGLGDGEHLQAMAPVVSESQEEEIESVKA